jgi:DNA-binding SARP family transcriptional activator
MLEYRALGGVGVVDGDDRGELGLGGPRQRRLAAALLIDRNRVVSVERLGEIVFAGEPTDRAATTLRSYVARLRRVVDNGANGTQVVTRAPGYMLMVDDDAFDVARFESSVDAGRAGLARGDVAGAARALRVGLALWRGGAYAEFADEEWARPEAQRLDELRLVAYDLLADADLARGRSAEVAAELEALVAEHPLRDSFQAKLILALYRSGRQVDALRAYQAHREYLMDEIGVDPPPELAELEARILAHDESLLDLDPGEQRVRGYRLGERLGTGRDGTVYGARLPGVERDIAIRAVPEAVADEPGFVRSFDADARRLGALRHPAVLPLYDWWREPGAAYVVMRRLRGGTLRDRLEHGPLSGAEAADLADRMGGALAAAAAAGVTHGRVSADSILFDDTGRAFLCDFPLGRDAAGTPDDDARALAELVSPSEATAGPRPNPYKGLRAFDEPDAADFFGREALVDTLVAHLAEGGDSGRLVAVVGGSGSGKSSVVRAGLLPRLRTGAVPGSDRWFVATMVPGKAPFEELAESLRRVAVSGSDDLAAELAAGEQGIDAVLRRVIPDSGELLLVVDQLEELFTLAAEDEQRTFFDGLVHALCAGGSRLRVVATLRADFYDRPLRFERFGTALGEATVPVAVMSAAELEAAIVGPAERVGARVEPALVAELVGAVVHQPAALPSLQFTLYELAERSADGHLTLDAYRDLGGVEGAIAARAETLYGSLDDAARAGLRGLFARLVVVGPEGEPTRRRALRSEVAAAAGPAAGVVLDVVEAWAQARLLSVDRHPESREPTVEVAHEALLREWPRLRTWLEEDRDEIVAQAQLREAAGGWAALDRDPGALYRGARLEVALDHLDGRDQAVPALEREFLDASRAERDREQQEAAERLRQSVRANRRLRAQLSAVGVALVVALVAGVVAVGQRNRAKQDSRELAIQALIAEAGAATGSKRDLGALLALAAYDIAPDADTYGALLGTFTAAPAAARTIHVDGAPIVAGVPLPDNKTVALVGTDLGMTLVDTATGRSEPIVAPDPDRRLISAWADASLDGRLLAVVGGLVPEGSDDYRMRLIVYDLASGTRRLDVEPAQTPGAVAISPDGQLVAVGGGEEAGVEVLAAADGQVVQTVPAVPRPPNARLHVNTVALSFLPDGSLAVGSEQGALRIVNPRSGEELRRFEGRQERASTFLRRSADGRTLVGMGERGLSAWDASLGLLWSVPDQNFCNAAVIDAVGSRVLCGGDDGEIVGYDLADGRRRDADLGFQHGELRVVAVTPDGSTLVEAGEQTVTSWRLDGGGAISRPMAADPRLAPFSFVGASELIVGSHDEPLDVDLLDVDEAVVADPLDGMTAASPTSDPDQLAVIYEDGSGGLYPLHGGGGGARGATASLPFVPKGSDVVGDTLVLWDPTHIQSFTVDGPAEPAATLDDGAIDTLRMSPDGTRFFTLEDSDLVARGPDGERSGPRRTGVVAVDTVDDVTVVATADGRIELIDPETLEAVGAPLAVIDSRPQEMQLDSGGGRAAVLGYDRTVHLVDVASRQPLGGAVSLGDGRSPSQDDRFGAAVLNAGGDRLALYTSYGTVVWDLRPDRMVEAACVVAGRNLTRAEWDQYAGSLGDYRRLCPDLP